MQITVNFWSYFADIAGTRSLPLEIPDDCTVGDAIEILHQRFPRLAAARKSTLVAVGVDYALPEQKLHAGDELSLFPPVQGG